MNRCLLSNPPSPERAMKLALAGAIILASMVCVILAQAQPVLLAELPGGSSNFISLNSKLYFSSGDSLFRTTSQPGTVQFFGKANEPIISISKVTTGNSFYFVTSAGGMRALWKSDGTTLTKLGTAKNFLPVGVYRNELVLAVEEEATGRELWKLAGNTTLVRLSDISPGPGSGFWDLDVAIINDVLYFRGTAGGYVFDIYKTLGTPASTTMAVNVAANYFDDLTAMNNTLFFDVTAGDYYGQVSELWKSDGTQAGTLRVKQFPEDYSSSLSKFTVLNGKLFFVRNYGTPVHDLYVSDGTGPGTVRLKQVGIDGGVREMIAGKDRVVFYDETQSFPGNIQVSNGTTAGTYPIHGLSWEIDVSSSRDEIQLTAAGNLLYFIDHIRSGTYVSAPEDREQLFISDYTAAGTKSMRELYGTSFRGTHTIVADGDNIFFTTKVSASKTRLWYYDPAQVESCAGTGSVRRELWTNVSGSTISAIPVGTPPDATQLLSVFEGPTNAGDRYGDRIRGYFCPPASGSYVFYISGNDYSDLYLSSSDNPALKQRIAYVAGATNYRQWDKYTSQKSAPVFLVAGRRYYIESLHKEGIGSDHLSVGVQLPDGTMERPVSGANLIPYEVSPNAFPVVAITSPVDDAILRGPTSITIEADASDSDGSIARVEFYINSAKAGEDTTAPYSFEWSDPATGDYQLKAKAIDNLGAAAESEEISIRVWPCAQYYLYREIWTNVSGSTVSSIPLDRAPDRRVQLGSFEAPPNYGTNYGSRIRALICVPQAGYYRFYIASNDHSELWLSTDANPDNKTRIAWVTGATLPNQWDKYASQQSMQIWLQRGTYYIEALHKQGVGTDNLSVGWQLPNGTLERPISGNRLSPYEEATTNAFAALSPEMHEIGRVAVEVYPNPVRIGNSIRATFPDAAGPMHVEVLSMSGRVIETAASDGATIDLPIDQRYTPGIYLLRAVNGRGSFAQKFMVE